jgi:hypothetical protein
LAGVKQEQSVNVWLNNIPKYVNKNNTKNGYSIMKGENVHRQAAWDQL